MSLPDAAQRAHCFNPRAREGRDLFWLVAFALPCASFNPRAREGRDIS